MFCFSISLAVCIICIICELETPFISNISLWNVAGWKFKVGSEVLWICALWVTAGSRSVFQCGGWRFNPRPSRCVLEQDTSPWVAPCSCVYECNRIRSSGASVNAPVSTTDVKCPIRLQNSGNIIWHVCVHRRANPILPTIGAISVELMLTTQFSSSSSEWDTYGSSRTIVILQEEQRAGASFWCHPCVYAFINPIPGVAHMHENTRTHGTQERKLQATCWKKSELCKRRHEDDIVNKLADVKRLWRVLEERKKRKSTNTDVL